MPRFKRFAESLSGSQDLYTKAVAPFVLNKSVQPYEHKLSLAKLKEFGARRVIQMPGGLVAPQRFESCSWLLAALTVQQPGEPCLCDMSAHPLFQCTGMATQTSLGKAPTDCVAMLNIATLS